MVMRMLQKWIWAVALIPYYIVYSTKAGGFGQIVTDLETYSIDKLKTKVGNIIMGVVGLIIVYGVGKARLPVAAKVILLAVGYFIFGYNLFKVIDDPRPLGRGAYGTTGAGAGYFGRTSAR